MGWSLDSSGQEHAVVWIGGAGPQDLGTFGGIRSMANDASGNGSRVVGWAASPTGQQAFLWRSETGLVALGDLGGNAEATGISGDGRVIVGSSFDGSAERAVRWTDGGAPVDLGALPGTSGSAANGVSSDGTLVVGASEGRAVVWNASGIVDLASVYADRIPAGWTLVSAQAASREGRYVVGTARVDGRDRGFWLDLAPSDAAP